MLHLGNGKSQEQPYTQAKKDSFRQRMYFAGEHTYQHSGDDSLNVEPITICKSWLLTSGVNQAVSPSKMPNMAPRIMPSRTLFIIVC